MASNEHWYSNISSHVQISGSTSGEIPISRGVRQGSVRSPLLFLLVMAPVLLELKSKKCGLNVCGLYLGAFSHADDIRTLSNNVTDCKTQISDVKKFADSRGLVLNFDKCEAVVSPSQQSASSSIISDGVSILLVDTARCLGAWWTPSLSCSKWIEINIKKTRGAFFVRGQGVFLGSLNPLSSQSIVESFVMPVLLLSLIHI